MWKLENWFANDEFLSTFWSHQGVLFLWLTFFSRKIQVDLLLDELLFNEDLGGVRQLEITMTQHSFVLLVTLFESVPSPCSLQLILFSSFCFGTSLEFTFREIFAVEGAASFVSSLSFLLCPCYTYHF